LWRYKLNEVCDTGKFTAKMLYGWDDGRFEEEYLRKLERNW